MSIEFGQRVSAYMFRAGVSQEELARKAHKGTGTLRRVVRGERELSVDESIKIADALRIRDEGERAEFQLFSNGLSRDEVGRVLGRTPRTIEQIKDVRVRTFRDSSGRIAIRLREYLG